LTKTFLLDTYAFFKMHLVAIMAILLPFTIPLEIFSFLYYENTPHDDVSFSSFIPAIVYFALYPIFGAALVFYVSFTVKRKSLTTTQAWALGIQNWPSYFLLSAILILAIGFGFALFIIPGLFLAARLAFSEFDLLLKSQNPVQSLASSWTSSREYFWVLLNGGLIITLIIYAPYFLITHLLNETGLHLDFLNPLLSIIESVLMSVYTIYAFRVYDFATQQHSHS